MTTLRLATWNLGGRILDPDRRYPAIAAALGALDADVVGLQEVWPRAGHDLAAELASELGRRVAVTPVRGASPRTARLGDPDDGLGNAVLSRWPLRDVRTVVLPGGGSQVLLDVVTDTPAGSLRFLTTHLTPALTDSARRVQQVREIARHVARAEPTDLPPVVAGDLNAEPSSDEVRLLEGHLTAPAEPGLLLADAWRWAGGGDDRWHGATWRPDNPHVAARGDPASRVDYVLLGLGRGTVPVTVGHVGLLGTRAWSGPDGEVWPSDHAGVVVDLEAGT